jgi:hypothetical protein
VAGYAVRPRNIVVHGAVGIIPDPDESAERPLPLEALRVDDLDGGVRSVGEVIFGAFRIDEADVE